jgi:hypothetical protein
MTAKEKAAAGLWMLKQAIFDLLSQPEHGAGMQPSQVTSALGLRSAQNEAHGIAYSVLKRMVDDGELEKTDEYHPLYFLPGNQSSGGSQP